MNKLAIVLIGLILVLAFSFYLMTLQINQIKKEISVKIKETPFFVQDMGSTHD